MFGNVSISKNTDPDNYFYSGYRIRFDCRSICSIPGFNRDKNVFIFGVEVSSTVNINNKNKEIGILSKEKIQGLDYTTLTAETENFINFSRSQRNFV